MFRTSAICLLLVATAGNELGRTSKPETKDATQTDVARLSAAAKSCNIETMRALIAGGVDVNATDDDGYSALSYASKHKAWTNKLKCPEAVSVLTQAGADPWKSRHYQNPRLNNETPQLIGVITVEDRRETKENSPEVVPGLTKTIQTILHDKRSLREAGAVLGYPILRLDEVRQKLGAAGWSGQETNHPDPIKACGILGADAVFEAVLKAFSSRDLIVRKSTGAALEFTLTDCRTGELLWRTDNYFEEARLGLLTRALQSNWSNLLSEGIINFPRYQKRK